ncbi:hypothetical protein FA10DRAFT_41465 [Acaromyces ingoldii]|uniref:Nuclear pore complex protein Nup160 n=1 Tax=Acaromyces ingoldii TaxID=215250 RepID=A0A316YX59_9BASI|nr:hypothetical protein FA10DRAFT_41465 [Acaromyces ingoldii]PWN94110.1 hypothetical protein FA10DRAFT_41465 [Acaromyces ingoldii]
MSRLFSRTNVNGASGPSVEVRDGGSPTHPLGIETFVRSSSSEHTLAISASRDRKLRLWDLSSDACIRVIDLPFNVMMADAPPDNSEDLVVVDGQEARASLPTTAKIIIKAYSSFEHDASSPYPLYFVVFVPTSSLTGGFFALYGVQFDGAHRKGTSGSQAGMMGDVGDVDLLWQKECDIDTRGPHAELRDVAVLPTKDEPGTKWRLWSLWDVEGKPLSKYTTVGEDEAETWSTVSTPVFQAALHGSEMDQDLGARMHMMQSGSDMATFFLERVLEAGRYTLSTLDKAVTLYADDLEAHWPENMTKPPSLAADAEFSGLAEQIASLVGCNVQLEADPASGALGYESYWGAVRREWSRFVGILDDLEAKARWPVGFVDALPTDDVGRDSPFVVSSELLSLPVVEDGGLILERLSSTLAPSRLEVSPALATTLTQALRARLERGRILSQRELDHLLQIAQTSNGSTFFHLVGNDADALQGILDIAVFAQELFNGLERTSTTAFEAALEEAVHTETSLLLETIVSEAWIQHVQSEMVQEEEDTLTLRFQELKVRLDLDSVDGQGLILALLDTLFEGVLGQRDTGMSQLLLRTELGVALASDSFTQLISSRLALVRSLCYLVAAVASDVLSLTTVDVAEIVSRTLIAWQRLVALHSLVSLEGPPETAAEEPVSEVLITGTGAELDADAVANRIDRLGFSENSPSTFIRDVGTGDGVSDDIAILDGVAINPLHACLMAGHFFSIEEGTQGLALSTAVPAFTSAVLGFDCLFENDTASLGLTRAWAMLAHNLIVVGYPSAAASILARFWPGCASSYLLGRCAVMTGNAIEAARHFDDVARTLMSPEQLQDLQGGESDDEGAILISLLPSPIRSALGTTEALVLFYRHVALYMASLSAHEAVARYAKLALDQTELVQGNPSVYSPSLTRDLWFALFRAQLTLGDFESSYTTVMAIPKTLHDLKRDSLRSLIGVMCESGHIAQLLKMSFAGEQAEVERTLSFKARNSDPFTTKPNYYRVLYSFYTKRGDLKSAGAVMYQQGTRLGDIRKLAAVVRPRGGRGAGSANAYTLDKEESIDLAILEANCYLAAVNVLALIEPRDAWFADALPRRSQEQEDETAGEEENQASSSVSKRVRNPRTGLTSYIPRSRFASDSHEISIVRLADVRRLCRLCLARLELAPLFPEVALSLDAMSAVLLFARVDEFDKALTLARDMGLDESGVLASLTERCVGLARVEEAKRRGEDEANDDDLDSDFEAEEARFLDLSQWSAAWKGRTSSRAWRYLRLQLDLSSSSSTSASSSSPRKAVQGSDGGDKEARCRIAVLDKILSLGAWQSVPKWLVEWFRVSVHLSAKVCWC